MVSDSPIEIFSWKSEVRKFASKNFLAQQIFFLIGLVVSESPIDFFSLGLNSADPQWEINI
jgi:hypothetical protein